jgi:hypothetical protein
MESFKVLDTLDKTILSEESFGEARASHSPACWPSEASAIRLDQTFNPIVGTCHRKSYYRMIGLNASNKVDVIGSWRFVLGRLVETHVTELTKVSKPPIWVGNGVKLFVKDIGLSLEMDVIVKDPLTNKAWILECKTFYGNFAKRALIGVWGKPKLENVMQICLYLLEAKNGKNLKELIKTSIQSRLELDASGKEHRNRCEADLAMVESLDDGPVGGKLVYLSRDEGDRTEFDITIVEHKDGFHYPYVNGICINSFTVESIYERYRTLQNYWYAARNEAVNRLLNKGISAPPKTNLILSNSDMENQLSKPEMTEAEELEVKQYLSALEAQVRALPDSFLPPAEFEWAYSAPKIEQLYKIGEIGKTKYNDWKNTQTGKPTLNKDGSKSKRKPKPVSRIGDWQCLHPNTPIVMKEGYLQNISTLKIGDETYLGKVLEVKSKLVDRPMVNVKPYNLLAIDLTSDHLYKTEVGWIESGKLKRGNIVEIPFDQTKKSVGLTFNELFIIGLWTAEGCFAHHSPDGNYYKSKFTIHPDEDYAATQIKLFASKFTNKNGVPAKVTDRVIIDKRNGNSFRYVQINSKAATEFLMNWTIGRKAGSKSIHPLLMKATLLEQKHLLEGLIAGDRCRTAMRTSFMNVYSTVSRQLAFDLQVLNWRRNQVAGITAQKGMSGFNKNKESISYHVRWYDQNSQRSYIKNGSFFTQIFSVKPLFDYKENVWDIEVEGSHKILTTSGIVHNCGYCPYRNTCIPKQNPALAYQVYDVQNEITDDTEVEFED